MSSNTADKKLLEEINDQLGWIELPKKAISSPQSDQQPNSSKEREKENDEWTSTLIVNEPYSDPRRERPRLAHIHAIYNDAITHDTIEALIQIFKRQIVFLPSQAEPLFGEYYEPFKAAGLLIREIISSNFARTLSLLSDSSLKGNHEIEVIRVAPFLYGVASFYSAELNYALACALSVSPPTDSLADITRECTWQRVAYEIQCDSSHFKNALAFSPPVSEIDELLPLYVRYKLGGLSQEENNPIFKVIERISDPVLFVKKLGNLIPETMGANAITVVPSSRRYFSIVFSPLTTYRLFDRYCSLKSDRPTAERIFSTDAIIPARTPQNLRTAVTLWESAFMKGEIEITRNYALSSLCLRKISKKISHDLTSEDAFQFTNIVFSFFVQKRLDGLYSPLESRASSFQLSDIQAHTAAHLFSAAESPQINVGILAKLADGIWTEYSALFEREAAQISHLYYEKADLEGAIYSAIDFGFSVGILDIARSVDKKGKKGDLVAVRLNRDALIKLLIPGFVSVTNSDEPVTALPVTISPFRLARPHYSYTVEILPNCELFVQPNAHPVLRLVLVTLFSLKGENSFVVDSSVGECCAKLGISGNEILQLLKDLATTELPPIVVDRLKSLLPGTRQAVGFYRPHYVLTNTTSEQIKKLMENKNLDNYFAAEIAPQVWGLYDQATHYGSKSLEKFEITIFDSHNSSDRRLIKALQSEQITISPQLDKLSLIGHPVIPLTQRNKEERTSTKDTPLRYVSLFELTSESDKGGAWTIDCFGLLPEKIKQNPCVAKILGPSYRGLRKAPSCF